MTTISSTAECKVGPQVACTKILSESGLKAWWVGNVKIESLDPQWPAVDSKMVWRAGGGKFEARVTKDNRPQFVEMFVATPSANSIIRHSFEELQDGGTKYTKSVQPIWRNAVSRFFSPLMLAILRPMVKKEVARAVVFAEAH